MSKREIRQSINSQVLTVFFLPLAAAGVHMLFAFPIISGMLRVFGMNDASLFALFYNKNHYNYGEEIAAKALIYAVLRREIPIIQ